MIEDGVQTGLKHARVGYPAGYNVARHLGELDDGHNWFVHSLHHTMKESMNVAMNQRRSNCQRKMR